AIAVYRDGQIVAYLFSTFDVVRAPGYSSVPFDVIAGVDLEGHITGARVIQHSEPYLTNFPVREGKLDTYLAEHRGYALLGTNRGVLAPDFVAGATVSARAMRRAILDSARLVLRGRGAGPVVTEPTL